MKSCFLNLALALQNNFGLSASTSRFTTVIESTIWVLHHDSHQADPPGDNDQFYDPLFVMVLIIVYAGVGFLFFGGFFAKCPK